MIDYQTNLCFGNLFLIVLGFWLFTLLFILVITQAISMSITWAFRKTLLTVKQIFNLKTNPLDAYVRFIKDLNNVISFCYV